MTTTDTKDRIMDAHLALHAATSRLLDDAELLRKRRDELLQLVSAAMPDTREKAEVTK